MVFMPGEQRECRAPCSGRMDGWCCLPSLVSVAMLSLSRIGMPWRGLRGPVASLSLSSLAACWSAFGLVSKTARRAGP